MAEIELTSWVKEAQRRDETVKCYLVRWGRDQEVIETHINPNFVAGIVKYGVYTSYKLVPVKDH